MRIWCGEEKFNKTDRPDKVAFISKEYKQWKIQVFLAQSFFFHPCFSEKNKTVHLHLYLPWLDNNQSKNITKIVFELIKTEKNSGFLCL